MKLSTKSASLFFVNLAYLTSIIYVPIVIANNAVTNKIFPFFCFVCLLILLRNEIKSTYLVKFSVVFLLAVSSIISIGSYISLAYTLVFLSLLAFIFPYFTLAKLYGKQFLYKHIDFILTVSLVSVFLGWLEFFYPSIIDQVFFMRGSIYLDRGMVSSLYSNPNVFGLMMAFSFQIALMRHKNIFIILIFFALFLSAILLTGSRMASSIIYVMLFLKIVPLNRISQKITLSITLFLAVFFSLNFNLLYDLVFLNQRDEIWEGAKNAFFSNPLFGIGLGQFQEDVLKYVGGFVLQSANNMFIGLLSELGLVGFILFNFFWIKPILFYKKGPKHELWNHSSTMLLFLIGSQFSEYMVIYVGSYVLLLVLYIAVAEWSSE